MSANKTFELCFAHGYYVPHINGKCIGCTNEAEKVANGNKPNGLIWEDIDDYHKRAKVFGGWLVKAYEDMNISMHKDSPKSAGYEWQVSMCFVPDHEHEGWYL